MRTPLLTIGLVAFAACTPVDGTPTDSERAAAASWGDGRAISPGATVDRPRVSLDPSGHALVLWTQSDQIWWSRATPASEVWSAPRPLSGGDGGASQPRVSALADGDALAIWMQAAGEQRVQASRYDAHTDSWSAPQSIHDGAGTASLPQLDTDRAGNAVAIWQQYVAEPGHYAIWASRYEAATAAWSTAEAIHTPDDGYAINPQVSVGAEGHAVAVWQHQQGHRYIILSSTYDLDRRRWTSPHQLCEGTDTSDFPVVSLSPSGQAVAAWVQLDGDRRAVYAATGDAATGTWEAPALIDRDASGWAAAPTVAVDAAGDAIAVWQHHDGDHWSVWSSRWTAGEGSWQPAELLDDSDSGDAHSPELAVHANGDAIAVWHSSEGDSERTWSRRFHAEAGAWAPPVAMDGGGEDVSWYADVAVRPHGPHRGRGPRGVVVWQQSPELGASGDVHARVYGPPPS